MCICAASARSIVKAMSDLIYSGGQSRLITVTQIMLAMVVLAIYISKTKHCWMNESDLAVSQYARLLYISYGLPYFLCSQLLINCSEYAEEHYIQMGQDREFIRGK